MSARIWIGVIALLGFARAGLAAPVEYFNDRFGYMVAYPADLYPEPRVAANNDGITLQSTAPSSELLVWGSHNALGHRSAYEAACPYGCNGETYRVATRRVGVSSGRDGGSIYYIRCVGDRDLARFACFSLRYREADRTRFDPVIEILSQSLRLLEGSP